MADSFDRHLSVNDIVGGAMASMGLTPPSTVVGSSNAIANQLVTLANEVGLELMNVGGHRWRWQEREFAPACDGVEFEFDLPSDWEAFIGASAWDRTNNQPVVGSLPQFEWQMLQSASTIGTLTMVFRMEDDKIIFLEPPPNNQDIVLPYRSRGWLLDDGGTDRFDTIQAASDVVLYDSYMFRCALRLRWREEKGFDTKAAQRRYDAALSAAKGKDSPSRNINLDGRGFRMVSMANAPETGYGS